jgi:hypothetical protein
MQSLFLANHPEYCAVLKLPLSRASLWMAIISSLDKFQNGHLPETLTMLTQGGPKVFQDCLQFGPARYQSLGAQFVDAVF